MPPKKVLTHEEKAQALQVRAHALNSKAAFQRVVACLKARPDLVPAMERQLKSLGALTDASPASSNAPPPLQAIASFASDASLLGPPSPRPPAASVGSAEAGASSAESPSLPAGSEVNESQPLEKNITCWGALKTKHLTRALKQAEPDVFTDEHLKRLVKRGAREASHAELSHLHAFMTGIDPQSGFPDNERTMKYILERTADMNMQNGRRARHISLPPNWDHDGIYRFEIDDCKCTITHKPSKATAEIMVPPLSQYYFDMNWSESRCCLRSRTGVFHQLVMLLFLDTFKKGGALQRNAGTPGSGKRRRLVGSPAFSSPAISPARSWPDLDGLAGGESTASGNSDAGELAAQELAKQLELAGGEGIEASASAKAEAAFVPPAPPAPLAPEDPLKATAEDPPKTTEG